MQPVRGTLMTDAGGRFQSLRERLAGGSALLAGMTDGDRQSLQGKLTRTDGDELERVTDGDRRFFERHKRRNHRLRPAAQIEIEQNEIIEDHRWELPRGWAWFTIVQQIAPGLRVRVFIELPETTDPDISERAC